MTVSLLQPNDFKNHRGNTFFNLQFTQTKK